MSSGMYQDGIKALASCNSTLKSLARPDQSASVDNPFCGDRVDLDINIEKGRLTALAHEVRGCMLCHASANGLGESAIGLSREEIDHVSAALTAMLRGEEHSAWPPAGWEFLALFEPVARHKSRHGCVTLAFKALLKTFESSV